MGEGHPYLSRYARFFRSRANATGYEFQHAPSGNVPPPKITFTERLRWWTVNRAQRMKKIRAERDRLQQEILDIKKASVPKL